MNSVLQCLSNTKPLLLLCFDENLSRQLNSSNTSVMKGVLMRGEKKRRFLFSELNIDEGSRIRHHDPKHVEFIRWQISGQSIGI